MNIDVMKEAIENDDIIVFKLNFNIEDSKKSVEEIDNYLGLTIKSGEKYKVPVNYLQYAIHCNSEKIFNFLIEQNISVNKDENQKGTPPLMMAIKESRFNFAKQIINHKTFEHLEMSHLTLFHKCRTKSIEKELIDIIFHYLSKFSLKEIKEKQNYIHNLVFYNEDTLDRFENYYKKKFNQKGKFLIEKIFENDKIKTQIFEVGFKSFILKKLSESKNKEILEKVLIGGTDSFFISNSFKDESAKNKIQYLFTNSIKAKTHFEENARVYLEMSLDALKELDIKGVDFFKNYLVLFVIFKNKDIELKTYILDNYPNKVIGVLEEKGILDSNYRYCQNKILKEEIDSKNNNKKEIRRVKI